MVRLPVVGWQLKNSLDDAGPVLVPLSNVFHDGKGEKLTEDGKLIKRQAQGSRKCLRKSQMKIAIRVCA